MIVMDSKAQHTVDTIAKVAESAGDRKLENVVSVWNHIRNLSTAIGKQSGSNRANTRPSLCEPIMRSWI